MAIATLKAKNDAYIACDGVGGDREIVWKQVSDSSLVHKTNSDEMLVTHFGRTEDYLVAKGTFPSGHEHYGDLSQPHADVSGYVELTVQATEVITQMLLERDRDTIFVLREVEVGVTAQMRTIERLADSPNATVVVSKTGVRTNRDGRAYALDGPFYCYVDGELAATVYGTVAFFDPDTYAIMRGTPTTARIGRGRYPMPTAPARVGRARPGNVLIGDLAVEGYQARARIIPLAHPAFFDRPLDHYPGMMTAEAARQLAVALATHRWNVTSYQIRTFECSLQFQSFAELHSPPELYACLEDLAVAEALDRAESPEAKSVQMNTPIVRIVVSARQGSRTVLDASFTLTLKIESGGSQ